MSDASMLPAEAHSALARLIDLALEEDLAVSGDATTEAVLDPGAEGQARIFAKQDLVVCGIDAAVLVLHRLDPEVIIEAAADNGQAIAAGDTVLTAQGSLAALLTGERTALNFLQRLSGVATLTAEYVRAAGNGSVRVVDTRKTPPGWRALQKWAVRCGGGHNHRAGLFDGVMIKDNHIAAVGSLTEAVTRARANAHHLLRIEVEVQSQAQLEEALAARPDVIMLDNYTLEGLAEAVQFARANGGEDVVLEASGGVTLKTIGAIAATGVDVISVGALTHSAPAADLSMDVTPA